MWTTVLVISAAFWIFFVVPVFVLASLWGGMSGMIRNTSPLALANNGLLLILPIVMIVCYIKQNKAR